LEVLAKAAYRFAYEGPIISGEEQSNNTLVEKAAVHETSAMQSPGAAPETPIIHLCNAMAQPAPH